MSDYLSNVFSDESKKDMNTQNIIHRTVTEPVVNTLHEMELIIKNVTMKTPSVSSECSRSTTLSNKSAVLIALQAAKTRV